jgi:DNA-binding MarR family transcriptional regulator
MTHPTLRLKRTYLAMRRAIDDVVRPFGFTAAQFDVIQLLLHEGEMAHHQLQDRLAMTSPTLTNILDGMVRDGFVERRVDPEDGRVRRIALGEATRQLCASGAFKQAGDRLVAQMFKGLTAGERATFQAILDRVDGNLGERAPGKGD